MTLAMPKLNRRDFLRTSASGAAGLVIGFYLPRSAQAELPQFLRAPSPPTPGFALLPTIASPSSSTAPRWVRA